mmetsp:Transcript_20111/g.17809  ORF Transcript_20111/g.17809 Transcript_20111/m.17809 type:complete len:114 (-) Transcript_20111:576-917(-)
MLTPKVDFDSKRNKSLSKVSYLKSDNHILPNKNGNFYNQQRNKQGKTLYNQMEDSLNDSIDIRKVLGSEKSPEINHKLTAKTLQNNLLKETEDKFSAVLNEIYLADCCPYFYL